MYLRSSLLRPSLVSILSRLFLPLFRRNKTLMHAQCASVPFSLSPRLAFALSPRSRLRLSLSLSLSLSLLPLPLAVLPLSPPPLSLRLSLLSSLPLAHAHALALALSPSSSPSPSRRSSPLHCSPLLIRSWMPSIPFPPPFFSFPTVFLPLPCSKRSNAPPCLSLPALSHLLHCHPFPTFCSLTNRAAREYIFYRHSWWPPHICANLPAGLPLAWQPRQALPFEPERYRICPG